MNNTRIFKNLGVLVGLFFTSLPFFSQNLLNNNLKLALFSNIKSVQGSPLDFQVQRTVRDEKKNLTFYYITQTYAGLPILNGTAVVVEKKWCFSQNRQPIYQ
jgi:hypothetical protein